MFQSNISCRPGFVQLQRFLAVGLNPSDSSSFAAITLLPVGVAFAARHLPAWRAITAIDNF
jgi:hypothetical protein